MKKERINLTWPDLFKYNRLILGILLLSMLLATKVLIIVVISDSETPNVCNNPICLQDVARIKQYLDTNIDPCEDFYHFACGKFLKSAEGNEQLGYLNKFKENQKRGLLKIYKESIQDEEHKMVKAAKQLFNACMNEKDIENDNLQTIKKALRAVGGWPVVEGPNWNETNFNWLQASYKFRELGYYFSTFLELGVQIDPDDKNAYILSVKPPNVWDPNLKNYNNLGLMADIALIFGAKDVIKTGKEMIEVQDFLLEMQMLSHSPYYNSNSIFKIQKYQVKYKYFNWLKFINNMARLPVPLSQNDFVIFPAIDVTRQWFRLLSKTPKRIQANYMIWKVIQELFPYLTLKLQKRTHTQSHNREEFCLRQTEKRFIPSPIGIIYDRRFLSHEKKNVIKEQILQIKSVMVDMLNQTEWMEEDDKIQTIEKAKTISLVFGLSENSSNDQILDDLDMDMMANRSETFLNLLAEANRNHKTYMYNNIRKTVSDTVAERWYVKNEASLPLYSAEDNIIYIPTVALEGSLFQDETPRYLNYGAFGYQLGGLLTEHIKISIYGNKIQEWSNYTKEAFNTKISCMRKELEVFQLTQGLLEIIFIIRDSFGEQISYIAYEKWIENHGEEQQLHGLPYTPKQLFWISAATTFCQPVSLTNSTLPDSMKDPTFIANIVSASKRNIPEFAKDFSCLLGSRMNPSNRCNFVDYTENNSSKVL